MLLLSYSQTEINLSTAKLHSSSERLTEYASSSLWNNSTLHCYKLRSSEITPEVVSSWTQLKVLQHELLPKNSVLSSACTALLFHFSLQIQINKYYLTEGSKDKDSLSIQNVKVILAIINMKFSFSFYFY